MADSETTYVFGAASVRSSAFKFGSNSGGEVVFGEQSTATLQTKLSAVFNYGLAAIQNALNPDINLDTDQASGSTIVDVSGNGRDFTVDGVLSTDFTWAKNLTLFPYLPGRLEMSAGASWTSDATFDGEHSMIIPLRGYVGFGTRYFWDSPNDRMAFAGGSAGWGVFDTGARYTDYNGGDTSEFMLGFTYQAGGSVRLFANGLFVEEIAGVASARELLSGEQWALGQRFDGSSAIDFDFFGFIYKNGALSDREHYETWRRATRLEHHYKTHIEGTSLETGLRRYWPTFDTDGAEVLDVSGNANHGAIVGGANLASPPLELGFRTGFRFGSTQYLQWSPGVDLRTDSFSVAFTYQEYLTKTRGIFGINDTTDYVELGMLASGPILRVGATTGTTRVGTGANFDVQTTQRFVITFEAGNVCRLYQDGVMTVELDISTLIFSDTSSFDWRLNNAPNFAGGFGSFTGFIDWSRALSASEAADVWATPTIDGAIPAPETKYVASDALAGVIPDSSGNSNGAAVLEGTPTPSLVDGKIALTGAGSADQYLRLEAGIAAQVASSQAYTSAFAMYLDNPDSTFAVNSASGGNLTLFLQNSGGLTFYGPSAALLNRWNYDRSPAVMVTSYDAATHEVVVVMNGVLLQQGEWRYGSPTSFAAGDMWSLNNEYDGPTTPSNIGTVDFFECQLFDRALSVAECINVCRDMFNRNFGSGS